MTEVTTRQTNKLNARGQIVATFGDNAKPFTPADHDAFRRLPGDGSWFKTEHVDHCIKNPLSRCERLVAMGLLESTVTGSDSGSLSTLFRKLESATATHVQVKPGQV